MIDCISRIESGDLRAFDRLYNKYKGQFLALFRKKFNVGHDEGLDLYQETCAALYANIRKGRLASDILNDASLRTYINQTGKYILFNRRRKRQPLLLFDTDMLHSVDSGDEKYDRELDDMLFVVRATVEGMPSPCSRLLHLSVFEKKTGKEIAAIMKIYADADSVKAQVYRCKGKLKEMVIERFRKYGYEY